MDFRKAFRDQSPAEKTQLLLSALIAQIFDEEDNIDTSMTGMSAPASADVGSDAYSLHMADSNTGRVSDDMGIYGDAEMNQAKESGESSTTPTTSAADRVDKATTDAALIAMMNSTPTVRSSG